MSIFNVDATDAMNARCGAERNGVADLVYDDDTLLLVIDSDRVSHFMSCFGAAGRAHGLAFNWKS